MPYSSMTALLGVTFSMLVLVSEVTAVVPMAMHARQRLRPFVSKRSVSASLQNYLPGLQYFVAAQVGTPPQDVELIVDTGSSDLWVFAPNACQDGQFRNCAGGTYDYTKSKTYKLLEAGTFSISYDDGTGVTGDYISDTYYLGGVSIAAQTMAVATSDNGETSGLMGIGFSNRESAVSSGGTGYPNVPDMLVSQGLIKTKAFSLYLDDLESSSGVLLFGGYDTAKFYGNLNMMPMAVDPDTQIVDQYLVYWTSLAINSPNLGGVFEIASPDFLPSTVLLDSGTNHIAVPTALYKVLSDFFNVTNDLIPCDNIPAGSLDFGLGGIDGPVIAIPFAELVIPIYVADGSWALDSTGTRICGPGFADVGNNQDSTLIFGQPFLRSAYVLYDLDNQQIGIAQARYGSTTSNIIEYTGSNTQNIQDITVGSLSMAIPPAAETVGANIYAYSTQLSVSTPAAPAGSFPAKEPTLTQVGQSAARVSGEGAVLFGVCVWLMAAIATGGAVLL